MKVFWDLLKPMVAGGEASRPKILGLLAFQRTLNPESIAKEYV
jgi:hypothetical protein